MADLPEIIYTVSDEDGAPVAVADDVSYPAITDLVAALPGLTEPEAASELAQAVTHFARGRDYSVVTDSGAFEEAYRAQIAREDPNARWQQGVVRLIDFGMPNFGDIAAPVRDGAALIWTAADRYTGLPYAARVEMSDLSALTIKPMSLTPVPRDPEPAAAPDPERAARAAARSSSVVLPDGEEDDEDKYGDDPFGGDDPEIPDLTS
jgi:hypothetical protein